MVFGVCYSNVPIAFALKELRVCLKNTMDFKQHVSNHLSQFLQGSFTKTEKTFASKS